MSWAFWSKTWVLPGASFLSKLVRSVAFGPRYFLMIDVGHSLGRKYWFWDNYRLKIFE